ncbi:MAG: class I SAM-dependent methyltransferase [Candidatus Glassbacteria bacterium]
MELVAINCPLCGSAKNKEIFRTKDWLAEDDSTSFRVVKCLDCSLRFVNPRPADLDIPSLYPRTYFSTDIDLELLLDQQKNINREKAKIVETDRLSGRILDIGCQKGEFLEYMHRRGWEAFGVELSLEVPNFFGLPIHRGKLVDAAYPDNFFDVVTYWAVIEHIPDIIAHVEETRRILKPGGSIIMLTTNYISFSTGVLKLDDIPRHLVLFTKKTLAKLLENHGFHVEKSFCSNRISRISAYGLLQYLTNRLLNKASEDFYREHFRILFSPRKDLQGRLARLRAMSLSKLALVSTDRLVGALLDRLSLLLGFYGIIIVKARKKD